MRWLTSVMDVETWENTKRLAEILIYKKGDRKECTTTSLSLPSNVKYMPRALQEKAEKIVELMLEDNQCGFRPGRRTMYKIFTLRQSLEKSWKYTKDVFACLIDLKKMYDLVLHDELWRVLLKHGIDWHLLLDITSLYCQPEVWVRLNGKQSKSFHVGIGFRQMSILSPLFFIICMNWMDKLSRTDKVFHDRKK